MLSGENICANNYVAIATPHLMMDALRSIAACVYQWLWWWWLRYCDCVILCSYGTYIAQYECMYTIVVMTGLDEVDPD